MQNSTLPIVSGATSASPAPQRQNNASSADGAAFAQTLSRQIEQRQQTARFEKQAPPVQPIKVANPSMMPPAVAAAPAPAPAPTQQQATPDTPVCDAPESSATAGTTADHGAGTDKIAATDGEAEQAKAADASPVADLIAFVASFNQPAAAIAPATADAAATVATRPDQLAAQASQLAAADPKLFAPVAPSAPLPSTKGDAAQSLSQMFDRARPAVKGLAADSAAGQPGKTPAGVASAAAAAGAADTLSASTPNAAVTAAADQKPASFANLVQASVEAASARSGDKAVDLALHDSATAPLSAPVAQASLALAQAAGTPTDRLSARVGTPAWDNQVGQKVIFMAAGQDQSATLTLNPPDLGPLQVVLSVSNDQAQVTFSAAQPEVRAALENAMPKLREMMSESGLSLGNASVNDGSAEQRQAQGDSRAQGGRGAVGNGSGDGQGAAVEVPVRRGRVLGGNGAVDTFA